MLRGKRQPGISFVIRARNEAEALFNNLVSLADIKVPHEIIVVLHRCTDKSKEVAQEWQLLGFPVFIHEDATPVSRAGYETLITPVAHPNSFPAYCTRCFDHAFYHWLVRWDVDFVATPEFIQFVNNRLDLADPVPATYCLPCSLGGEVTCVEEYMFNTYLGFGKYFCWEQCAHDPQREQRAFHDVCMTSHSPKDIKPYWRELPWFLADDTYDATLADKYKKLVALVGPEPPGFARSNNPDFFALWGKLMEAMPALNAIGIYGDK